MKIAVILGSVRQGRLGERVARLTMRHLEGQSAELLDLKDYPLPFYEEADPPTSLKAGYADPVATKWAAKIGEADAFVFITPEYNHGYSAVLKNAIDYVYTEWNTKPVLFVSYSNGPLGGSRAVEQLRQVTATVQLFGLPAAVHIPKVQEIIDEAGTVLAGLLDTVLDKQLTELTAWARLLQEKRNKR